MFWGNKKTGEIIVENEPKKPKVCETCGCVIGEGQEKLVKRETMIKYIDSYDYFFCKKCAPKYDKSIRFFDNKSNEVFLYYKTGTFECNEQGEVYGIAKPKKK